MIMDQQYMSFIQEHFDLTDDDTRQRLISVNEAERDSVLNSLSLRFYNDIMNKVDDIDFGTIPDSKGDITKIENYVEMMGCINTLRGILTEYKQPLTQIEEIETAVNNMIDNRTVFERAFKIKADLPVVIYCTMVFAIVSSISLLITSSIEFIKNPVHENFTIEFNRAGYYKTQNSMLYSNIVKFNKSVKKGEFTATMDELVKSVAKKQVSESVDFDFLDEGKITNGLKSVASAFKTGAGFGTAQGIKDISVTRGVSAGYNAAKSAVSGFGVKEWIFTSIIALIGLLIIIRELVFIFFNSRVKISDYFEAQADIMQMNAYIYQNNETANKTPEQKAKTIQKQLKLADRFRSISNFFAIKNKEGEVKTQKQIASESKSTVGDLSGFDGDSLF